MQKLITLAMAILLMTSTQAFAKFDIQKIKPGKLDTEGYAVGNIDFAKTSLQGYFEDNTDDEEFNCFSQLIDENSVLEPLLEVKGSPVILPKQSSYTYSTQCDDLLLVLKLNAIDVDSLKPKQMGVVDSIIDFVTNYFAEALDTRPALAGDNNYPGINYGSGAGAALKPKGVSVSGSVTIVFGAGKAAVKLGNGSDNSNPWTSGDSSSGSSGSSSGSTGTGTGSSGGGSGGGSGTGT